MTISSEHDLLPRLRRARPLAVAAAGLGIAAALAGCSAPADDAETGSDRGDTGSDAGTGSGTGSGDYADGTYSAEGSYQSPGGTESIGVELTLESGVVTAVTVTPEATGGNAVQFQNQFASGIADEVVGKPIDELDVTRVAGSSLTSGGFDEAVEQIKADAAA
ncbi:FMN-binding protein [Homoserinibacter sp. YIM 151385]|uniref:FMN-binding protein n=1 Tax=Homoserinibacter sp. YIM 151385 TaxID=2985506 RepID=UPI0022F0CBFC|nr:hypothetical protein [Homoserinibacter sp. YIM 151385]WBU36778.1 hypothetical protein OF852_07450 [Homoserinibacter sp. YIM 151385]